jgi:hypothetical protein
MAFKIQSREYLIAAAAAFSLLLVTPCSAQVAGPSSDPETDSEIAARLSGSGNDHSGILQVNQSSADGAQQANILSVANTSQFGAAIANSTASQQSADNLFEIPTDDRGVAISGAANAANGLVAINQSSVAGTAQINNSAVATTSGNGSLALAMAQSVSNGQISGYQSAVAAITNGPVSLTGSGNGSSGIYTINQAAALGGSQANGLAAAVASNGIANANASHSIRRSGGSVDYAGTAGPVSIADSFNAASGVVQINQASGGYNSQANLLAIAIGNYGDATAISDSGLSEIGPQIEEASLIPARQASEVSLAGSFEGFSGIAQVSQVSGFGNAVSNNMTITLSTLPGPGL